MTSMPERKSHDQEAGLSRRTVLLSMLVVAGAGAIVPGMAAAAGAGGPEPSALCGSPRIYAWWRGIRSWVISGISEAQEDIQTWTAKGFP
jgi:hypothetical protein